MRSSKSRSRNKSNRQRTLGNVVNRVFDSSGPEGKVRGTPQQIIDKYLTLARDAQLSNDRVAEQSFLQHAEHYTRMLGEAMREQAERQGQNHGQQGYQRQNGDDDREGSNGNGNHHHVQNQGRGGHGQQHPYGGQHHGRGGEPMSVRGDDGSDGPDDLAGGDDTDERSEFPRFLTQSRPPRDDQPAHQSGSEALPYAVTAEDERDNDLVETPESQIKAKRPRAPRGEAAANRGERAPAAPRRRKPKADASADGPAGPV